MEEVVEGEMEKGRERNVGGRRGREGRGKEKRDFLQKMTSWVAGEKKCVMR